MNPTTQANDPIFAQFDKLAGTTTPPPGAPAQSWSDQLRSMGKASTPPPTPSNIPGTNLPKPWEGTPSTTTLGAETAKQVLGGGQKIAESVTGGAEKIQKGDVLGGITQAGLGSASGAVQSIFAPLTAVFQKAADVTGVHPLDAIASSPVGQKMNEWAQAHPDAARNLSDALNVGLAAYGGAKGGDILNTDVGALAKQTPQVLKETATGVGEQVAKVAQPIEAATKAVGGAVKAVAEKIFPTPTIDSLIGKVAQGKPEDIPSFARGLSTLDTTKVNKYSDLQSTSDAKIGELAKKQDILLSQDPTNYKVQQLATKVGDVRHNYVIDAIQQLKDYYTKTNDIKNLGKINVIEAKLDPTTGSGLTLKEVNDIARMHGSDLNAYNANGELASGLTRQAAENTRQGLKTTVRNLMPDEKSRGIDKQISDLYTVRDLSKTMATKVATLEQRLQKPNILQKIGGYIGKGLRFTGIGDMASKLLGIEKVPGAQTLNAVELEARLSKNLKRIDAALAKDDTGFLNDIQGMAQEPVSTSAPQPSTESASTQNMK